MAATPENATTDISTDSVLVDDDEIKYGFQRQEMFSENLSGSVHPYERHVFLVYKTYQDWPARVESSVSDPLPKRLAGAIRARKDDLPAKGLLTICEGGDANGLTDGDVLIFPDMIKYRGLEESNIDSFVEEVLVNSKPWNFATAEVVTGSYVFVCAHNSRDKRCGVCGPALIEKFNEEIEVKGLKDQVFVSPCSHIGGHKYAGNLIIYSAVEDGKVSGHWYGYVTPNDVPELLEQHIKKGEIIERIWRGEMGIPPVEKTEKVVEQSLPNGNDTKASETDNISSITDEKENFGGCCQGANGFSCCKNESSETKKEGKKVTYKLNFFTRKWEQHEIFTAAAVVGAVATVAVAYSLYKRSR
uniref:altered inheritance of mitochondria protein 32-like n=1 Tax=Erigeron canadensis TaxID=72917 RepID=UPI001CB88B4C|nr:altered inheritance of mitochondria protein 32-like [Erigeron canadensis]